MYSLPMIIYDQDPREDLAQVFEGREKEFMVYRLILVYIVSPFARIRDRIYLYTVHLSFSERKNILHLWGCVGGGGGGRGRGVASINSTQMDAE